MLIAVLVMQVVCMLGLLALVVVYVHLRREKDNEYYTDYKHKNLIIRIFKPEFEYQALGDIPNGKLLDRGILSPMYNWALIELN